MTEKDLKPFTLTEPRYDQNTYWGRVWAMAEASDVRYAFVSNNEVVRYYNIFKNQQAREKAQ
jgi:hypothetical protein